MATINETLENNEIEANCVELALEGQRLCRSGDIKLGIKFFETALSLGTEDLNVLMVVYSQLGNAYFTIRNYSKSLHYHRLDLDLSRRLGDLCGEGKASGNLGNTLKMLGKHDEAVTCCEHHLNICRQLKDQAGVVRALYNLANVYHNQAKTSGAIGREDVGQFPDFIRKALEKAAQYYEENLVLSKEIGDKSTQGLACGNLANTHYLLGNFQKAVELHTERLIIAKEFGHQAAERRAYSNRGNAYIFLANFDAAIDDYRNALRLAKELNDETLEAQVCYSLGNTYYILRQYSEAASCLEHHASIAKKLNDKIGEARACWSLTNIHSDADDFDKAKVYASTHLQIAEELGDSLEINTALENLKKLDIMIRNKASNPQKLDSNTSSDTSLTSPLSDPMAMHTNGLNRTVGGSLKVSSKPISAKIPKSSSHGILSKRRSTTTSNNGEEDDENDFFTLLSKYQSRRMDEQRCSFQIDDMEEDLTVNGRQVILSEAQQEFLDLLAGVQGARMNDQRASMPDFPGLRASPGVLSQLMSRRFTEGEGDSPNDAFFEMVMRCQATRIEDQRSNLPAPLATNSRLTINHQTSVTVPDEDLFTRILRLQSSRLDEQRCAPPFPLPTFSLATVVDDGDGVPEPTATTSH